MFVAISLKLSFTLNRDLRLRLTRFAFDMRQSYQAELASEKKQQPALLPK